MGLIASYNLRSMIVRKGTAAMTAGGIAMVVAVFVMTLSLAQGFKQTLVASGSPQNAIVLRKGSRPRRRRAPCCARTCRSSRRCRRWRAAPTAVRSRRPNCWSIIALPRKSDNQPANVPARGVGAKAFEVRDNLKFVEGRRFAPGTREINVGKAAVGRFKGLTLGSDVKFGARGLEGGRRLHGRRCVVRVGGVGRRRI